MRAVIQRVTQARVRIESAVVGEIKEGVVILLGVCQNDTSADAKVLAEKIVKLRIFNDDSKDMTRSLLEAGGEALVVSQVTLCAAIKNGRRLSFNEAAAPPKAQKLYEEFVKQLQCQGTKVNTGKFGAVMQLELINDGPVSVIFES